MVGEAGGHQATGFGHQQGLAGRTVAANPGPSGEVDRPLRTPLWALVFRLPW
ncbi:MAG: hypothetical protein AVDCRST_MAG02-4384 [uncultured Rubrobacteraceae bacterium]|uniref:Uncharacterized protein n=1 Tax=uncultured Rubrobacteraceae bacterium TaxID=349277 RepID=A0A6J4RIP2_9ACTN|nr:MAG: hypothetical protein AVDCRST_MAG02-4384 [uncultured Rubrobacteraceae bacterium]